MKVYDLVRVYNDPINCTHKVAEGVLGVVVEIRGRIVYVQFGSDEKRYMYRAGDLASVDNSDTGWSHA